GDRRDPRFDERALARIELRDRLGLQRLSLGQRAEPKAEIFYALAAERVVHARDDLLLQEGELGEPRAVSDGEAEDPAAERGRLGVLADRRPDPVERGEDAEDVGFVLAPGVMRP